MIGDFIEIEAWQAREQNAGVAIADIAQEIRLVPAIGEKLAIHAIIVEA